MSRFLNDDITVSCITCKYALEPLESDVCTECIALAALDKTNWEPKEVQND